MVDVLIVDDEVWVTELIKHIIDWNAEGFSSVFVVNDGLKALEIIKKENPRLVLTDIRMPEMDGLTMLQEARKEGIETQFIIISGYSDFGYAKDAIDFGAAGYLLKPIDRGELLKVLNRVKTAMHKQEQSKQKEMQLKQDLNKSLVKLREQYFLNCFNGNDCVQLDVSRLNHEFLLNFSGSKFLILIIAVDAENKTIKWNRVASDFYGKLLGKNIFQTCAEMVIIPYRKRFICILNYNPVEREKLKKNVSDLFHEMTDIYRAQCNLTIAMGNEKNDINGLKDSYHEAKILLRARVILGTSAIYNSENVHLGYQKRNTIPPEMEMKFKYETERTNIEGCKGIVSELLEKFVNESYNNPCSVVIGAQQILDVFMAAFPSGQNNEGYNERYIWDMKEDIEDCASVEQIQIMLFKLFDSLSTLKDKFQKSKNEKNNRCCRPVYRRKL